MEEGGAAEGGQKDREQIQIAWLQTDRIQTDRIHKDRIQIFRIQAGRAQPDSIQTGTKRAPRCTGMLRSNGKETPRCLGALLRNGKRAPPLHGNAILVRMVQRGTPKRVAHKCPKPLLFNRFLCLFEPRLSTRGMHIQKDTTQSGCQRAPKAIAQNLFSVHILQMLLFGIHAVAAPNVPFILKISRKAMVLQRF